MTDATVSPLLSLEAQMLTADEARIFYGFEREKPPMKLSPIWIALPAGLACWAVLAAAVWAAWTWL